MFSRENYVVGSNQVILVAAPRVDVDGSFLGKFWRLAAEVGYQRSTTLLISLLFYSCYYHHYYYFYYCHCYY